MSGPMQINPGNLYRAVKPIRDPERRRFVKQFPCIGCGRTWGIDPMHTGPHGLNQKSCDFTTLPGCRRCHEEFDADPRGFAQRHGLDIPARLAYYNGLYARKIARRAA